MINDYVCATNKYSNLTYGKIYRVHKMTTLTKIIDDRGFIFLVRGEIELMFITLNEWRNRKLEQLGI